MQNGNSRPWIDEGQKKSKLISSHHVLVDVKSLFGCYV